MIEMVVKPDELGWMLALGWTLVDDESRFRTEDGCWRITTKHIFAIDRAIAEAIGLTNIDISKEDKLLISSREWDEIRGIEHTTCEGDVACIKFQPSTDLNTAFEAAAASAWKPLGIDELSGYATPALAICANILKLKEKPDGRE